MLQELNRRLTELQERIQEGYKIRRRLEAAEKGYNELQKRIDDIKKQLEKEKMDVDRLEGMNLINLFYSILGTKEERLEKAGADKKGLSCLQKRLLQQNISPTEGRILLCIVFFVVVVGFTAKSQSYCLKRNLQF